MWWGTKNNAVYLDNSSGEKERNQAGDKRDQDHEGPCDLFQ